MRWWACEQRLKVGEKGASWRYLGQSIRVRESSRCKGLKEGNMPGVLEEQEEAGVAGQRKGGEGKWQRQGAYGPW